MCSVNKLTFGGEGFNALFHSLPLFPMIPVLPASKAMEI